MARQPWFPVSFIRSTTHNRHGVRFFRRARLLVEQLEDRNAAGRFGVGDALAEAPSAVVPLALLQADQPDWTSAPAATEAVSTSSDGGSDLATHEGTTVQDTQSTINDLQDPQPGPFSRRRRSSASRAATAAVCGPIPNSGRGAGTESGFVGRPFCGCLRCLSSACYCPTGWQASGRDHRACQRPPSANGCAHDKASQPQPARGPSWPTGVTRVG
jgi:hypothetical protein